MTKKTFLNALISPLTGICLCVLIILFYAQDSREALTTLFTGCLSNRYYLGTALNTAAFLMISGIGASLSLKGGNLNLGGEGQIYLGGYIACLILTNPVLLPAPLKITLALLFSTFSGAFLALISAFLKEKRGAEVLLTTFLASEALKPFIDGLITNARHTQNQNLLALPYIAENLRSPQILYPSPLSINIFIAIILCILCFLFLEKTFTGNKLTVWGKAPEFALYSGYSSKKVTYFTLTVSGALHALTGFLCVVGTYYTCHKGFANGMGWASLSASLIVSANPIALLFVSLVLGWLYTSADLVGLTQGFSFDISGIIQGFILFTIAVPFIKQGGSKK